MNWALYRLVLLFVVMITLNSGCLKESDFVTSKEVVKYLKSSIWEIKLERETYEFDFSDNSLKVKKKQQLGEHGESWSHDEPGGFIFRHTVDYWAWEGGQYRIIVFDNGRVTSEGFPEKGEFVRIKIGY